MIPIFTRLRALRVARAVKPFLVRALMLFSPRLRYAVVHGYPDSEGNSVEIVRALVSHYRGHIFLLAADPTMAEQILDVARIDHRAKVTILPYRSLRALARFITAEISLFTHGVYGCPKRVPRKTMVNLWHGGGIKVGIMADEKGRPYVHADYLVAATRWKGIAMARQCKLPADGLLLTGNPRIDQFGWVDTQQLAKLGIAPDRPFIVWMPTFRKSTRQPDAGSNANLSLTSEQVDAAAQSVVKELANAGIQTVVKPHPSDAESHKLVGAITVTNKDLVEGGMFLYQLLGASSGLLTDYSSVWIDYLTLDRPIGFLVPDEGDYVRGRGFDPPDALDWLPGPRIQTTADIAAFAEDVLANGVMTAARRAEVSEHIGLIRQQGVAERIVQELAGRGRLNVSSGS